MPSALIMKYKTSVIDSYRVFKEKGSEFMAGPSEATRGAFMKANTELNKAIIKLSMTNSCANSRLKDISEELLQLNANLRELKFGKMGSINSGVLDILRYRLEALKIPDIIGIAIGGRTRRRARRVRTKRRVRFSRV